MVLLCFCPPQRERERSVIDVTATVVLPQVLVPTLVDGAPAPPAPAPPPPPPPPAVGLSWATAIPPAVTATAVAPKAAMIAFRVLICSSPFSEWTSVPHPQAGSGRCTLAAISPPVNERPRRETACPKGR